MVPPRPDDVGCTPVGESQSLITFGKAVPNVKCNANLVPVGFALQLLHSIFDWLLLSIPIIVLLRLKMRWQRKLQCIIPLCIGALSAVGASRRIYDTFHPNKDLPFHFAPQLPWNILDMVCAVCVTSLPAVNNLLTHYLPKTLSQYWPGSTSARSGDGYGSKGTTSAGANGRSKLGSVDEDSRQITVQRDIDLESMRTEVEENPDPGFLQLQEAHRPNKVYAGS
ncbi:MAG: hypothetical protein Q9219_005949 [cf. Caloplaca sp. 3 TL-2023]